MGIKTIGKRGGELGEEEITLECGSGSLDEGSKKEEDALMMIGLFSKVKNRNKGAASFFR